MIMRVYAIHDSKVEAFNMPFYQRTHGEALRNFEGACSDEKSQFRLNASDYTLYYLGEFDDFSSSFTTEPQPMPLAKASEVLSRSVGSLL